jgi:iron complex transport system ATP-binding protein
MGPPPFLELRDAVVVRDGVEILRVDRLTLAEGERVAVLGPNGSGKSTLVGLLTRDIHPVSRLEDPPLLLREAELWNLLEARAFFGVVTSAWQELYARPVSVRDEVLSGFFGSVGLTSFQHVTDEHVVASERAMQEAGIAHLADRLMDTLSTGEARRALIARALVHDPAVLVLDEPYAGLDPAARSHVGDTVRALARSGRGLLLVTHHIEDIPPEVDRVVMLRDGRVFASGPKVDLLTDRHLSELFGIPVELEERDGVYRLW